MSSRKSPNQGNAAGETIHADIFSLNLPKNTALDPLR
jgi:hypothetical protein